MSMFIFNPNKIPDIYHVGTEAEKAIAEVEKKESFTNNRCDFGSNDSRSTIITFTWTNNNTGCNNVTYFPVTNNIQCHNIPFTWTTNMWWPATLAPTPAQQEQVVEEIKPKSIGTFCAGCNEDFPYAEPVENFACYKCRNKL